MKVLRTPDERFERLPGYPWAPRYTEVDGVRIHHVEDGPAAAGAVLLLRGAGHFVQEDAGAALGRVVADWLAR